MTDVTDLAAWLTQIWDEQEKAARDEAEMVAEYFPASKGYSWKYRWSRQIRSNNINPSSSTIPGAPSPAEVLARIAADRQILGWCTERERVYVGTLADDPSDPKNYIPGGLARPTDSVVVRLLASPYADKPGFRDEWRAGAAQERQDL